MKHLSIGDKLQTKESTGKKNRHTHAHAHDLLFSEELMMCSSEEKKNRMHCIVETEANYPRI